MSDEKRDGCRSEFKSEDVFQVNSQRTPIDYVYQRCYTDKQGNTVDPRTFWDVLLKYHKPDKRLLVSEGNVLQKRVEHVAARLIAGEDRQMAARRRIDALETADLDARAEARRKRKRRKKPRSEMGA